VEFVPMSTTATRMRADAIRSLAMRTIAPLVVLAALLVLAAPALGGNGITPLVPKRGDTVPVGSRPVFKGKVKGRGPVWVHVCRFARKNADGLICTDAAVMKAHRRGGRFSVRARFFDFPAFWLNRPGRYYWQAHRISCERGLGDCRLEGPVVRFRVG
jgi:hypothetical protein